MPSLRMYDSDSDDEGPPGALVKSKGSKKNGVKKSQKNLLAITDGRADDESDGSMPELQSVSDSSDESDEDLFDSEAGDSNSEDEDNSDHDDESEYDSDEEEQYRTMLREAMDAAMAIPEFFDPKTNVSEFETIAEERKGNPFLKLLGSLRGMSFLIEQLFDN